ncbi:MAG: response regulator transcription factor [Egibacteraceae bacterium]
MRIVLADEEDLFRGAFVALLEQEADVEVVAAVGNGDCAVAQALEHRPDIVVLDVLMPGRDGIEAAADIRARMDVPIVIVTRQARPAVLRRALQAGVQGFVPKTTPAERLVSILRDVQMGNRYIDPEVAARALTVPQSPLTPREAQVLRLTMQGGPVAAIAEQVSLAAGTVRNYLSTAMAKVGARNRFDAARIAAERGWI